MKSFKASFNIFIRNCNIRRYSVKRKYPLDPCHAEKLHVFDYVSKRKDRIRVYAWGYAQTGALGLPLKEEKGQITEKMKYPKRLTFAERHNVVSAATGFGFTTFIVNEEGKDRLYATGLNTDSQIGYHLSNNKKNHLDILLLPQVVELPLQNPETTHLLKVAAGRAHTIVLSEEGLFMLGNNAYGQCGRQVIADENYNGNKFIHTISNIDGERIIDIEAGQDHSLAITESGKVYATGWGADGQTGQGHYNTVSSFSKVNGDIEQENIVKIACTSDFVLALNDKGEVFGWGNTEYGQLSKDDTQQCSTPTYVEMCKPLGKIKDIASGGTFCMVLDENGGVYLWGYGLLGLGPKATQSLKPVKIPSALFGFNDFNPESRVESISCGLFHMAAVTNNGELYMWGRNKCGCLGLGDDKPQYFPLKVALGASVDQILCGADHTIALCKPFA